MTPVEVDALLARAENGIFLEEASLIEKLAAALRECHQTLRAARTIVDEQAADEGIWFNSANAAEAYLQHELRRLHSAIEGDK